MNFEISIRLTQVHWPRAAAQGPGKSKMSNSTNERPGLVTNDPSETEKMVWRSYLSRSYNKMCLGLIRAQILEKNFVLDIFHRSLASQMTWREYFYKSKTFCKNSKLHTTRSKTLRST